MGNTMSFKAYFIRVNNIQDFRNIIQLTENCKTIPASINYWGRVNAKIASFPKNSIVAAVTIDRADLRTAIIKEAKIKWDGLYFKRLDDLPSIRDKSGASKVKQITNLFGNEQITTRRALEIEKEIEAELLEKNS